MSPFCMSAEAACMSRSRLLIECTFCSNGLTSRLFCSPQATE